MELPTPAMSRWHWLVGILAVAAVAGLAYLLWSSWGHEALITWKREAQPLPFFAAMAVLPAIGVPMTPLFVLAGATFGSRMGLLGSALALGAHLAICYSLAHFMRPWLGSLMRRFRGDLPDFGESHRGALRFTLAVKLTPGVPAFLKNYGLGVAGVPFGLYLVVSMLITGAYGAALVVLGESLFEHDRSQAVVAVAVVVVLAAAVWIWRSRSHARQTARA
jgi:uncharacterized membrane protein YdjX (TVP38/TMEM64 family)